jgi:oligopeptide transport system ATP-binding protein
MRGRNRIVIVNQQFFSMEYSMHAMTEETPILQVEDLATQFNTPEGTLFAVNHVSFNLQEGEVLGVVGESGCGKSVTMLSILRLTPGKVVSGQAFFNQRDLLTASLNELNKIRCLEISMVFQDPMCSLNPVITIGRQIAEPLEFHLGYGKKQARERVVELLSLVGIPEARKRLDDYPHQFSGGMRQRCMIAIALSCNPKIVIADEPTTALDVTIQAQIVELVQRLQTEMKMSLIWITHDLGVIAGLAERVIVMYGGKIIEEARVGDLYRNPRHPYTVGLLESLPRLTDSKHEPLQAIDGIPPTLYQKPTHCTFAPRCKYAFDDCWEMEPRLKEAGKAHTVACWAADRVKRKKG